MHDLVICVGGPWQGMLGGRDGVPAAQQPRQWRVHRFVTSARVTTFYNPTPAELQEGVYELEFLHLRTASIEIKGFYYRWHELLKERGDPTALGMILGSMFSQAMINEVERGESERMEREAQARRVRNEHVQPELPS